MLRKEDKPDKEPTVRITADIKASTHRKLLLALMDKEDKRLRKISPYMEYLIELDLGIREK